MSVNKTTVMQLELHENLLPTVSSSPYRYPGEKRVPPTAGLGETHPMLAGGWGGGCKAQGGCPSTCTHTTTHTNLGPWTYLCNTQHIRWQSNNRSRPRMAMCTQMCSRWIKKHIEVSYKYCTVFVFYRTTNGVAYGKYIHILCLSLHLYIHISSRVHTAHKHI